MQLAAAGGIEPRADGAVERVHESELIALRLEQAGAERSVDARC